MLVIFAALAASLPRVAFSNCSQLSKEIPLRHRDIPLVINGESLNVTVMGEGGIARATAALYVILFRYGLGYSASLKISTPELCELSDVRSDWKTAVNVVAPKASMNFLTCTGKNQFDALTSQAKVTDVSLHLMAHLWNENCTTQVSDGVLHINTTVLQSCSFISNSSIASNSSGNCNFTNCFLILARNETKNDMAVTNIIELIAARLPFQVMYFFKDSLLRKKIRFLKDNKDSFLFIDDNIWTNTSNIFYTQLPLKFNINSYNYQPGPRAGNGLIMQKSAPKIYEIVTYFVPLPSDLLHILENEITTDDIEEAACMWAIQNLKEFKQLTSPNLNNVQQKFQLGIKVYLCKDDPYIEEYHRSIRQAIQLLEETKDLKMNIQNQSINCYETESILQNLHNSVPVEAFVTWGWTPAIERLISYRTENNQNSWQQPIVLVGPTPVESSSLVHLATGSLVELIKGLKNLLRLCKWSRIAILSDNSTYSKKFALQLRLEESNITYREIIVSSENINSTLENLKVNDARIIFVNAHWSITGTILCRAQNREMASNRFIWITRDWRFMKCENINNKDCFYHYTLELTSRRFKGVSNITNLTSAIIDSYSLADALVQLGNLFSTFYLKHPSHIYTIGTSYSIETLSESLNATMQTVNNSNRHPFVIIGKWQGDRGEPAAIWQINPETIVDTTWSGMEIVPRTCEVILGRKSPEDRSKCLVQSGDPYSPRCHDTVLFISVALVLLPLAVLYKLYRNRCLLRKQHQEYLIKSRQHATSTLESYIAKRHEIQLLHVIGEGSFGRVYFAKLLTSRSEVIDVAAKEPRKCFAPLDENIFLHEACILATLNHENIIRFVGVCLEDGPPIVLMEHALYNDLQSYLMLRRQIAERLHRGQVTTEQAMEVSDEQLTRFAREAAAALNYLSKCRLIHRDVRAGNCLVDRNRSLKLADFGMARELDSGEPQYITQRCAMFPVIWMAPESIKSGIFSTASDVWSLGVLFLEVATLGSRPFGDWTVDRVVRYIRMGGHPPLPPDTSIYLSRLVSDCWHQDPGSRPSAAQLQEYLSSNTHVISPALLPPHPPESPDLFTR